MPVCRAHTLKWASLTTVVVQNTALYLTAHASMARSDGPRYFGSVAVLLTELIKAAISTGAAVSELGVCGLWSALRDSFAHDLRWAAGNVCLNTLETK